MHGFSPLRITHWAILGVCLSLMACGGESSINQLDAVNVTPDKSITDGGARQFHAPAYGAAQGNVGTLTLSYPSRPAVLPARTPLYLPAEVSLANAHSVAFELIEGPQALSLDARSGEISWLPLDQHVGTHTVSVRVSDSGRESVTQFALDIVATEPLTLTARGDSWQITDEDFLLPQVVLSPSVHGGDEAPKPVLALEATPWEPLATLPEDVTALTPAFRLITLPEDETHWQLQVPGSALPPEMPGYELRVLQLWQDRLHSADFRWIDVTEGLRPDARGGVVVAPLPKNAILLLVRQQTPAALQSARSGNNNPNAQCQNKMYGDIKLTGQWVCHSEGLQIEIADLHKAQWAFGPNADMLSQWVLDAEKAVSKLGLSFGSSVKLLIYPMKEDLLGFWSGGETVYINPQKVPEALVRATVVHELFHLAQGRRWPTWSSVDSWLVEGSARWFEDKVYDDENIYAEEEGRFYNYIQPGLITAGYGAAAQRPYQRFTFFKLLENRCNGVAEMFAPLASLSYAEVAKWLPNLQCQLGFSLPGVGNQGYAEALLFLYHALGTRRSLRDLDPNEPNWNPLWFHSNNQSVKLANPWQGSLNPGGGAQLLLTDLPTQGHGELALDIAVQGAGDAPVVVSVVSADPAKTLETADSEPLGEQSHQWLSVSQHDTLRLTFQQGLPDLSVRLLNPSLQVDGTAHVTVTPTLSHPDQLPVPEVVVPDKVRINSVLTASLSIESPNIAVRAACELNQQARQSAEAYVKGNQNMTFEWPVTLPQKLRLRCWTESEDGRRGEVVERTVAIDLFADPISQGNKPGVVKVTLPQQAVDPREGLSLAWEPINGAIAYRLSLLDGRGQSWVYTWQQDVLNCQSKQHCRVTLEADFAPGPVQLKVVALDGFDGVMGQAEPYDLELLGGKGKPVAVDLETQQVLVLSPKAQTLSGRIVFRWHRHPQAARYRLFVEDALGAQFQREFSAEQLACLEIDSVCEWEGDLPLGDGEAHWRVQVGSAQQWASKPNDKVPFKVKNQAVVAHKVVAQSPTGLVTSPEIEFVWQSSPLASRYRLNLTAFANQEQWQWAFSNQQAHCDSGESVCHWRLPSTLPSGVYEWRVLLGDAAGWASRYSEPLAITVLPGNNATIRSPLGQAVLLAPSDRVNTQLPQLKWRSVPGASRYRLSVNTPLEGYRDIDISAEQAQCERPDSDCQWRIRQHLQQGENQWRVRAGDAQRWADQATPWQPFQIELDVTTTPSDSLQAAVIIAPSGNHWGERAVFRWHAVSGVDRYRLVLETGEQKQKWERTSAQLGCVQRGQICSFADTGTLGLGAHQWWVRAGNQTGWALQPSRVVDIHRIE